MSTPTPNTTYILESLTVSNYRNHNDDVNGTVRIKINRPNHFSHDFKLELKLTADDCARIVEIMQERIAETMRATATAVAKDLMLEAPKAKLPAQQDDIIESSAFDVPKEAPDDETPF